MSHPSTPKVEPATPPSFIPEIPPAYQPPSKADEKESGERRIEPAKK